MLDICSMVSKAVSAAALVIAIVAPGTAAFAQAGGGRTVELGEGTIAFLPESIRAGQPTPVIVLLHGAGGNPKAFIPKFRSEAEKRGVVLLAVKSKGPSWDMIEAIRKQQNSGRGNDPIVPVTNIDEPRIRAAVGKLSQCVTTDAAHTALAGFSDGASYAMTIGPAHPDPYRTLLLFSPGFAILTGDPDPTQRVFMSHGRKDSILPFGDRETNLVPGLKAAGMTLTFRPFDGDHLIPPDVMREAFDFFLSTAPAPAANSATTAIDQACFSKI
jgi:phospholipase/carboxylesterase